MNKNHLPSIACKLSLNWVCAHFESASCVRVVLNKDLASRSLLDNSALVEWDFDDALIEAEFVDELFTSVHGVLNEK